MKRALPTHRTRPDAASCKAPSAHLDESSETIPRFRKRPSKVVFGGGSYQAERWAHFSTSSNTIIGASGRSSKREAPRNTKSSAPSTSTLGSPRGRRSRQPALTAGEPSLGVTGDRGLRGLPAGEGAPRHLTHRGATVELCAFEARNSLPQTFLQKGLGSNASTRPWKPACRTALCANRRALPRPQSCQWGVPIGGRWLVCGPLQTDVDPATLESSRCHVRGSQIAGRSPK